MTTLINVYPNVCFQKFVDFNSPEKDILLEHFKTIPMMEKWIANIIEEYIYFTVREYYPDGSLKSEYRTKYGEKDGEYKEWHDNGQLYIQTNYVEGKLHGEYKKWYDDGKLCSQTTCGRRTSRRV